MHGLLKVPAQLVVKPSGARFYAYIVPQAATNTDFKQIN